MSERVARRRISFLLATTFIISTAPCGIGAMAKDETPPAASDADAKAKAHFTGRTRRQRPSPEPIHSARHDHGSEQEACAPAHRPRRCSGRTAARGAGCDHQRRRRYRLPRQQHVHRDQDQHAAARHSAVHHRHHQAADPGYRRAADRGRRALCPGRQLAPGRRQPRPDRHPRPELDRRLLRQRHARRRADLSRSLQHRAPGVSQRAERDDLRPRRRRRRA